MEGQNLFVVLLLLGIDGLYLVRSVEDELVTTKSSTSFNAIDKPPKKYKQFLHVSDLHMDTHYDERKSCKKGYAENIEDKPYGNFMCDSPKILVKSAIDYMKKQFPNPDFILWTGKSTYQIRKRLAYAL